jgi:hypothetical protein
MQASVRIGMNDTAPLFQPGYIAKKFIRSPISFSARVPWNQLFILLLNNGSSDSRIYSSGKTEAASSKVNSSPPREVEDPAPTTTPELPVHGLRAKFHRKDSIETTGRLFARIIVAGR